ncbi:MAG: TM1802 family CRISPR-associated protein, partial [Bacteroidota bacterium]
MQDKAIIEIGKLKGAKKELPFQNFVDNLFPEVDNYVMLEVVFVFSTAHEGFDCRFREVDLVNVSTKNYSRYAYRKGSARGGDVTFTTKMGDVDKKFRTFYPKQVEDAIQFSAAKGFAIEEAIFRALKNCLLQEGETVKKQVRQSFESMGKKEQAKTGFSIRCEGLAGRQYLADFDSLRARILQAGTSGKSTKHSVTSEGHDSLCSCCLTQKPLLHGFASPFKYASVDKTGFVSGFFLQKNNWKNYPICSDCALDFELGKKYVAQHLSKNFYDKSYFLIPKLVIGSNPQLLNKVLQLLTDFKYQESDKEQLISREMVLMRRIAREEGQHNRFALNLLFYKERQDKGAIKIRLFLEQIFPS